jgi:hypothetical protein
MRNRKITRQSTRLTGNLAKTNGKIDKDTTCTDSFTRSTFGSKIFANAGR